MEAKYETVDEVGTKKFYLQYRFPPSSVNEVSKSNYINRREIGHGNLAERALLASINSMYNSSNIANCNITDNFNEMNNNSFPYSIRAESLITESCGSSSMATVCGASLALLDAGVPIASNIAGVAMGLLINDVDDHGILF